MSNKKTLYVHVPKTGGTFLREFIKGSNTVSLGHDSISTIDNDKLDEYFKIAFVRNPWDWHVSRYFYFSAKEKLEAGVSVGCDSGLSGKAFRNRFPSLKIYLDWGSQQKLDNFWLTDRYKRMCFVDGSDVLDFVGRFESIKQSMIEVARLSGNQLSYNYEEFYKDMESSNRRILFRRTNHSHYSKYYDEELIGLIAKKEEYIIERFGYEFEYK